MVMGGFQNEENLILFWSFAGESATAAVFDLLILFCVVNRTDDQFDRREPQPSLAAEISNRFDFESFECGIERCAAYQNFSPEAKVRKSAEREYRRALFARNYRGKPPFLSDSGRAVDSHEPVRVRVFPAAALHLVFSSSPFKIADP